MRSSRRRTSGNPTTGADVQTFRIHCGKANALNSGTHVSGGGTPTLVVQLRETGSASLQSLGTTAVPDGAIGTIEFTWDATNLVTADGSAVEVYFTTSKNGGGANGRWAIIDEVEWLADYSAPVSAEPPTGSITATGQIPTATATANQLATPGLGSASITGQIPTVVAPQTVTPGLGSATFTGYIPDVTIGAGVSAEPGAGSLAVTGQIPVITTSDHQSVAVPAGSAVVAGQIPTVTVGANVSATPGAGSVVLTGLVPSPLAPQVVTPAQAVLALTGYAPTASTGIVLTDVHSYTAYIDQAVAFNVER
jgi:hypothetical protein